MKFENYIEVTRKKLLSEMLRYFKKSEKTYMIIAVEIGVKTHNTVMNALNQDRQIVSDEVLTSVMNSVGLDGFVVLRDGEKKFFLNKQA